ncbi:hypothetical protein XENOCAPTIV_022689 [Xenoophorus captivus]|uniref:Uncharacterized protein n=1 Tax=Xenoophorus captivus TaxID=1517983 RepID=A0ABV0RDF8_9TELE
MENVKNSCQHAYVWPLEQFHAESKQQDAKRSLQNPKTSSWHLQQDLVATVDVKVHACTGESTNLTSRRGWQRRNLQLCKDGPDMFGINQTAKNPNTNREVQRWKGHGLGIILLKCNQINSFSRDKKKYNRHEYVKIF